MKRLVLFVYLFGNLYTAVQGNEQVFENSTNLCSKRCECNLQDENSTLYINCAGQQMKHTIANWPKHPKILKATFKGNQITTLERMPGSNAENIQLIYSECGIKYLTSGLFESAVNVRYLDLSHNLLESTQLASDVFKGPYNISIFEPIALQYLDLSYNQIHTLPRKVFEHTPDLRYLSLAGNNLKVLDLQTCIALSTVDKLNILNLNDNELTELPSDAIKHLPNLTRLDISSNLLDFVPQSLSYIAASLETLNISHNPILKIDQETFTKLRALRKIFANELYKLTRIDAQSFSHLNSLKVIRMSHNYLLMEIDERAFEQIGTNLEEVHLEDNSLLSLPVNLLPWGQLKVLEIADNDFTCDCNMYKITELLPRRIKYRNFDVPTCVDARTFRNLEIYALTNDTCSTKAIEWQKYGNDRQTYRLMQIVLTSLTVILTLAACVTMWIGYIKWKLYKRSLKYSFPNNNPVIYAPLQQPINGSI